jgi:hypothetical protein
MMSMITPYRTPAELRIPPIRIPYFAPCRDVPPHLHAAHRIEAPAYSPNYDFPSPNHSPETCVMCDVSFKDGVETDDGDTCNSCVGIYRNLIHHGIPMPSCSVCLADCYYIHRACGHSLCNACKYGIEFCPQCKFPI